MLRQACGAGEKVDLAAQETTLRRLVRSCSAARRPARRPAKAVRRAVGPARRPARRPCLATWQKVGLQEGLDSNSERPEATKA